MSFPVTSVGRPQPADAPVTLQVELITPDQRRVTAAPQVTVVLEAVPTGAVLTGTTTRAAAAGLAQFPGMGVNKIGSYRFKATAPNCFEGVSPELWIGPGAASKLTFVSYPAVGTVEEVLTPIVVELQDAKGNAVDASGTFNVTLGLNPNTATVHDFGQGTSERVLGTGGRALFTDSRVSAAGTYRLSATATTGGIAMGTMTTDLVVDTPPSGSLPPEETPASLTFGTPFPALPGTAGLPLAPITVEVRNSNNDVIRTAAGVVQLECCSCSPALGALAEDPTTVGPVSGPRTTVLTAPVVNGVATFTTVSIIRAGEWNLVATWSKGSLYTATRTVQIVAGATARLNFQVQPPAPSSVTAPTPVNPVDAAASASPVPIIAEALDAYGNRNLAEARPVTLEFNTPGRALQGTTTATTSVVDQGMATFLNVVFPTGRLGVQSLTARLGSLLGQTNPFQLVLEPISELDATPLSSRGPNAVSADGRYMVYERASLDGLGAVEGYHVWRRDRVTGQTTQIDTAPSATYNFVPAISPNGEWVVFQSNYAFNGATVPISPRTGVAAVQVWCWHNGTISLVSHAPSATNQGCNDDCASSDVNDSGSVVYDSMATDLAPNHRGAFQVYVGVAPSFAPLRISESAPGVAMNSGVFAINCLPTISTDGKVAFQAYAPDLPGTRAGFAIGIYRRDLNGSIMPVSEAPGTPGQIVTGFSQTPHISDNGRYVVYAVVSTDLPTEDPFRLQIYRRDCQAGPSAVVYVSEGQTTPSQSGSVSGYPSISADGRFVAFVSSEGLRGQAPPAGAYVYRRDCDTFDTVVVSRTPSGPQECLTFSGPSLASGNPTLCGFDSSEDAGYGTPSNQIHVYMSFTP